MTTDNSSGFNLFGFQIRKSPDKTEPKSFVPETAEDGGEQHVSNSSSFSSFQVDIDPSAIKNEVELVQKYREIALVSDIDRAVDEITNEMIIYDEYKSPIDIDFTEEFSKKYSETTKDTIRAEFKSILGLLNFSSIGSDIARMFYVDGKLAYHKVIDKDNTSKGIIELRYIDATKIKKVVDIKKERDAKTGVDIIKSQETYYVYSDKGFTDSGRNGLKIAQDAVAYVSSGLVDRNSGLTISYLHKAIRPLNQLRMMEDSEVIYRMVRAPQRRIFYIDTSGMVRTKAEQHIKDVMARYKNKQVYDATTGQIKDDKKHLSILEDFWLPRANGGKGTEITTLEGAGTLGSIESVDYFKSKLYESLNIPISRLQSGQSTFNMGRENEISRDEIKFSKFIEKLRRKFNTLFYDILRTQLILKGITTGEDWEQIKGSILFNYTEDNFYAEIKESEMLKERIQNAMLADPYVGKYFSKRKVQREILKLTDEDIKNIEQENAEDETAQNELEQKILQKYGIDPNQPEQVPDTQQDAQS